MRSDIWSGSQSILILFAFCSFCHFGHVHYHIPTNRNKIGQIQEHKPGNTTQMFEPKDNPVILSPPLLIGKSPTTLRRKAVKSDNNMYDVYSFCNTKILSYVQQCDLLFRFFRSGLDAHANMSSLSAPLKSPPSSSKLAKLRKCEGRWTSW